MFGFNKRHWAVEVAVDKVAVVGGNSQGVMAYAEEAIPPGVWERGVITNPGLLGERLGTLLRQVGCRGGDVRFVVPNVDVIERVVTIPRVPTSKMEAAVRAEVRRQLAVDMDQVYLRWAVVGKEGGHTVFLAMVLREAMDSYLAALKAAKYRPAYADLQSLAFIRGCGEKNGFFVNLSGDGFLSVTVAEAGVPVFSYGQMMEGLEETAAIEQAMVTGVSSLRGKGVTGASSSVYLFGEASRPEIARVLKERGYQVAELCPAVFCPADFPLARRTALLGALLA